MSILLIAEHNNKELRPFTLNAITAASQIDGDVHALLIGNNCSDVAKALSEIPLVKKVIQVEALIMKIFYQKILHHWLLKFLKIIHI